MTTGATLVLTLMRQLVERLRAIAPWWDDRRGHYQPERHYMRGPGPKWREKHGTISARTRP